jgi:hypothetical protein
MVVTRVAVTAFRAVRETEGTPPGPSAGQSPDRAPATPISTTTLTESRSPTQETRPAPEGVGRFACLRLTHQATPLRAGK